MPNKKKTNYPEIDDIREDLDSLKNNVVELTEHVKKDGAAQTQEVKEVVTDKLSSLQETGEAQIHNVEERIKKRPGQAIAMAFAAGVATSLLFGRK